MEPTNLIILTPTYRGPTKEWRESLQGLFSKKELRILGVVDEFGNADVADARNICATKGYKLLQALEAQGVPTHSVLWLDDDMSFAPEVVTEHLDALKHASAIENIHALTGWYVQRGDMHRLAMVRGGGETRALPRGEGLPYRSVQVHAGLGCLAMTGQEFVRMCEAAPLCEPDERGNQKMLITAPHRKRLEASWRWVPEDFAWCELIDGGVWTAPATVRYRHQCSVAVAPDEASIEAVLSA